MERAGQAIAPHDILELRESSELSSIDGASMPSWARESLAIAPFVIARRVPFTPSSLGVGVRGLERHQRWPCIVNATRDVARVIRPPDLVAAASHLAQARMPAMQRFVTLTSEWRDIGRTWGPTGSVAFELVTHVSCVTRSSDLDVVIYVDSPRPMTREEARALHASIARSDPRVDALVETFGGAFSLAEYATSDATSILLRTVNGPRLIVVPT